MRKARAMESTPPLMARTNAWISTVTQLDIVEQHTYALRPGRPRRGESRPADSFDGILKLDDGDGPRGMVKYVSCCSHSIIFLEGALGRDWPFEKAIGSDGECEAEDGCRKKW